MDYHSKYLKYKKKYIDLKMIKGGNGCKSIIFVFLGNRDGQRRLYKSNGKVYYLQIPKDVIKEYYDLIDMKNERTRKR